MLIYWCEHLKPPCVVVVSHILPAVRILVAEVLIDEYGMRQKDVAEKMDLTPAAITQYLKKIRGNQEIIDFIRSDAVSFSKIRLIAQSLVKGDENASYEELIDLVCDICRLLRENADFDSINTLFSNLRHFSCSGRNDRAVNPKKNKTEPKPP